MCVSIILFKQGNAILQSLIENVKVSKQIDNVLIVIGKIYKTKYHYLIGKEVHYSVKMIQSTSI